MQGEVVAKIRNYYREAFRFYDKNRRVPPISIEFYPYAGINHTIRLRSGQALVRIAESCRHMALPGQRALAFILVAKLFRKRAETPHHDIYNNAIKHEKILKSAAAFRISRRKKYSSPPKGEVYDLNELFDKLNRQFFAGKVKKPLLTWSHRKTYRVLGHHDAAQNTIVISRSLDTRETPRFIIEYVMFHEMLHCVHPTVNINGRRYNHTPAFRADERKFPHYRAAEAWIEKNVRRLQRAAKKK